MDLTDRLRWMYLDALLTQETDPAKRRVIEREMKKLEESDHEKSVIQN